VPKRGRSSRRFRDGDLAVVVGVEAIETRLHRGPPGVGEKGAPEIETWIGNDTRERRERLGVDAAHRLFAELRGIGRGHVEEVAVLVESHIDGASQRRKDGAPPDVEGLVVLGTWIWKC
jgi:hypothetical protein